MLRAEVDVTLADPDAGVEELRAMGETVREATIETEQLLESLLMLARSEAGVERRAPVDLAVAARRAIEQRAGEALEHEIDLRFAGPAQQLVVDGDPRLLERLVANLVDNAVRHNVDGGWATIELREADGAGLLTVSNGGAPVPAEAAARLLEPFQRLARRGEGPPGAGLGLSIVRSVASAHGGSVDVRARPGGGLEVGVRLPSVVSTAGSAPARAAAGAGRRCGRRDPRWQSRTCVEADRHLLQRRRAPAWRRAASRRSRRRWRATARPARRPPPPRRRRPRCAGRRGTAGRAWPHRGNRTVLNRCLRRRAAAGALRSRMAEALLIIDYQNDFAAPDGALSVRGGDAIAGRINALARDARFAFVAATRDWHPPDHASFAAQGGPWPPHCVQGIAGRRAAPGAGPLAHRRGRRRGFDADAPGYSGFERTDLERSCATTASTR